MVTADEFGRSFRGATAIMHRRADGLAAFDLSVRGLARSFGAITLTAPAFVVCLALQRAELGRPLAQGALFADPSLSVLTGAGYLASFCAMPLAMLFVLRGGPRAPRYVPFVVVWNWISVFGNLALAAPNALYLIGLQTHGLAAIISFAFALIVVEAQWFAAKVTLGVGNVAASAVVALGLVLDLGLDRLLGRLVT
jgi:hypothetical protein